MRNPKMRFRTLQDEHYSDYESRALKDVCTIKREIIDISKQGNSKFLEYSMPAFDAGCLPNPILGMDAKSGRIPIYGDVLLFNKLNVRKKRIWNIHNCPKNSICSAEFMPIVTTEVLQDYMYYLVSTEKFTKILEECSSGTSNSQKRITPSVFLGQILNFPCYEEQQKIAAFFTALDEKINFNQAKLKKLELIREDLLSKFFDKALKFECSGGWETLPFLELIDSIVDFRGRTPAKLGMDWGDEKNEYLALSALNVKNTGIDESRQDLHYGTKELFEKWMSGKELHKGQVLFTTEAPAGNVTRVPDERPYILSQRVIAFNVNNDYVREDFLQYLLQSRQVQKKILSLASGGTAKGVSQKSLSALKVSIPVSLDEQQKIADFFCGIDLKIELQIKKERLLRSLKQAFMQQMFV